MSTATINPAWFTPQQIADVEALKLEWETRPVVLADANSRWLDQVDDEEFAAINERWFR